MTLYEFNQLDKQLQYDEVVNCKCVYLDNFINGSQRFSLYAIDKFFIEIEYNSTANKIVGLKIFKTGDLLDRYSHFKGTL
jgi:hypothetical protein